MAKFYPRGLYGDPLQRRVRSAEEHRQYICVTGEHLAPSIHRVAKNSTFRMFPDGFRRFRFACPLEGSFAVTYEWVNGVSKNAGLRCPHETASH